MQKLLFVMGAFASSLSFAQSVTRIEAFTPTGEVGRAEQVHVQFSDFLFALGEQGHASPFQNTCEDYGKGRWLNPKEWVFEFNKMVPPHTECKFDLKPNQKSVKGIPLMAAASYSFVVSPPALLDTIPEGTYKEANLSGMFGTSGGVDPDQAFILHFDKKISKEEVIDRIFFEVDGKKVKVRVLDPKLIETIRKIGREWMSSQPNDSRVIVEPELKFPNQEFKTISLNDRLGHVVYFRTRAYFKAEMTCSRDKPGAPCSPVQPVEVIFNSPVDVKILREIKAVPVNKALETIKPKWNVNDTYQNSHEDRIILKGPFKAGATYRIELPSKLQDIRGRTLSNAKSFPLEFKTDHLPAVAKFPTHFGVIEAANPVLPLSVRNIGKSLTVQASTLSDFKSPEKARDIINWIARIQNQQERDPDGSRRKEFGDERATDYESIFKEYRKEVSGKVVKTDFPALGEKDQAEVIGIPIEKKGLHIVELESKVLGSRILDRDTPLYTSTAVLVTNLGVHFKWGQDGPSLAWVTELSSGKPVANAKVKVEACDGTLLASGETREDGTLILPKVPNRGTVSSKYSCSWQNSHGTELVVLATKEDDFSFTLSNWTQGIESWRFNLGYGSSDKTVAHTILARDLLKPGQKVQMKHYFREFHWQGFTVPAKKPLYVMITHLGSDESWSMPVKFSAQGTATSEWQLPETANLGTYSIALTYENPKKSKHPDSIRVGHFEVQEFRLPVLNVSMRAPDPIDPQTEDTKIQLQGTYISGGPASDLPIEVRFQRKKLVSHNHTVGEFVYSQDEPVKTGIQEEKAEDQSRYSSSDYDGEEGESDASAKPTPKPEDVQASKLLVKTNLDKGGSARVEFPAEVIKTDQDGEVMVAMNYPDPNGEVQTVTRSISILSRDRYLGIQKDFKTYFSNEDTQKWKFSLADYTGKAVPNESITVHMFRRTNYVHRARLVGGFYGYQTTTEVKDQGEFCAGKTNPQGEFVCTGKVLPGGDYLLEASAVDSKGRKLHFVQSFGVWTSSEYEFSASESDRLTLIPSQSEYNAGDEARIAVLSSFRDYQALVTFERGGVMDSFVTHLTGEKPEIKIPIKAEHAPNMVVSVFAVRGRLADPAPTGLVDLAKPAFKLGMTSIEVGIRSHELPITVKADKTVYQIREKAKLSIQTKPNAEVALAVVDKALLKLKPNDTWDLLESMMKRQNHSVDTFTLQMNIIGKRHFGKKATPFGGGGGQMMTRELLDSLVAWKPSLKADASGKIETEVKLNDSISSFVVVAIGSEGTNFFGSGKTEFAATQDLQIISSVPPTLRERDQLPLQFVLRNTTLKPLHVKAELKWGDETTSAQSVEVPAQGASEVKWDVKVPMSVSTLPLLITATAQEGPRDQVKIASKVVEVLPARVMEGYLEQLGGEARSFPVTFPETAARDKGGFRVQVQARLSDTPDSVIRFFKNYPYGCLEQQTSKAVGLEDALAWKKIVGSFKNYLDSNSLLKFFPEMRYGSIDLTAYILQISAEAGKNNKAFTLPNDSTLGRLLESMRKAMRGEFHVTQTWWPAYVNTDQRMVAGTALAYYEPIQPADYESLKASRMKGNIDHALSLMKILDLSPKTLSASLSDRAMYAQEVLSQYQFENTHLRLKDRNFRFFGPLGASPDGVKARTLLSFIEKDEKDNATKLLRALMEDMKPGYFDTTPGNAWGVTALKAFKLKYENAKVTGSVSLTLGTIKKEVAISETKPKNQAFIPVSQALGTGKTTNLAQTYTGSGKPWSFTLVEAAVPVTQVIDHGFLIKKEIVPVRMENPAKPSKGDIYEVKLTIESRSPQTWAVVLDPIPTGASILSTTSSGGSWIAFEERRMDRMQVFYEYIQQGKTEFNYQVRLNQSGTFEFPPTRIEAMYDPTQYGELPNAGVSVK